MTRSLLRATCALAAVLALGSCTKKIASPETQYGENPELPKPHQYVMPTLLVAPVAGWPEGKTPTVAEGLQVKAMATGLKHPRMVYGLPNGDVLVVEANGPGEPIHRPKEIIEKIVKDWGGQSLPGANRITLLRDANGDGTPELRNTYIDNLYSPFGVVLVGSDLYVANTDAILRFPYVPGQTQITTPGVQVTELPGGPIDHHWTKSLTASPDGSKLYVGVGSNSNITENGMAAEYGRSAIWEVDRLTGMKRIYANGIRNPTGVAFEPQSGKLWAIANERDEIGPNLVPDYLTSVREGGFYGWPYSYYGQNVDVRVKPQRPDLVAKAIKPDYALSSHVAPLGLTFAQAARLGPRYQNGAFVGEHGSWDRSPLNGYKVVYVPFVNGRPAGPPQDVVTGFLSPDNKKGWGRPVGVAFDRTGALLIADDIGNAVWRVSAVGQPPAAAATPPPQPAPATR